jgi:hypothetical protein
MWRIHLVPLRKTLKMNNQFARKQTGSNIGFLQIKNLILMIILILI